MTSPRGNQVTKRHRLTGNSRIPRHLQLRPRNSHLIIPFFSSLSTVTRGRGPPLRLGVGFLECSLGNGLNCKLCTNGAVLLAQRKWTAPWQPGRNKSFCPSKRDFTHEKNRLPPQISQPLYGPHTGPQMGQGHWVRVWTRGKGRAGQVLEKGWVTFKLTFSML
ncbi:hypothetical protein XENTR_v10013151 [Xenopus tropicalis]|nr:hypothetical protein XENTR_v10013151 [Xenopus tropicalis]